MRKIHKHPRTNSESKSQTEVQYVAKISGCCSKDYVIVRFCVLPAADLSADVHTPTDSHRIPYNTGTLRVRPVRACHQPSHMLYRSIAWWSWNNAGTVEIMGQSF